MSAADPKHGRWILPLVIGGLILFTYLFVNALPPAPVDDTTATTVAAGTGGTGGNGTPAETTDATGTTSTTTDSETAAVLAAIDDFASRTASLAAEGQSINDEYDAGTAEFAATRDALTDLTTSTEALEAEITALEVPASANEPWANVISAAGDFSAAAAAMLDGLVNTPGPDQRLESLEDYNTAAADLSTGYEATRSAI